MQFLNPLWLRVIKFFFLSGFIYLFLGTSGQFYLFDNNPPDLHGEISNHSTNNSNLENIFEEFEEIDNEILFFQRLSFYFLKKKEAGKMKSIDLDFIFPALLIQYHLLNLPPPSFS